MSQKITRNQRKAIAALLEYPTIEQAAGAIGVNPRTVFRWLDDTDFRLALGQAEGASLDRITRRLLVLGDQAVNVLEDIMSNPTQKGCSNRRLAATTILDQLLKLRELRNIEGRLSDLEAAIF